MKEKETLELKHKHKKELMALKDRYEERIHKQKMQRLELLMEIARLGSMKEGY